MIFKHTLILENVTPFCIGSKDRILTGRQIYGSFKEYAVRFLSIDWNNIDYKSVIFKNAKALAEQKESIEIYNRDRKEIIYTATGQYEIVFYSNKKDTYADKVINTVMKNKNIVPLSMGRGRSRGFGEFKVLDYSRKKLKLKESIGRHQNYEIDASYIFLSNGRTIKPKIFTDAIKSFYFWLGWDIKLPTVHCSDKRMSSLVKIGSDVIFRTLLKKKNETANVYAINGGIYKTAKPVSFLFEKPIEIPSIINDVWGVGEYIQYGYGNLSITAIS